MVGPRSARHAWRGDHEPVFNEQEIEVDFLSALGGTSYYGHRTHTGSCRVRFMRRPRRR